MPNIYLEYFHAVELLHNSFVAIVTVFSWQLGISIIHFDPRNICAKYELEILQCYKVNAQSFNAMVTVLP